MSVSSVGRQPRRIKRARTTIMGLGDEELDERETRLNHHAQRQGEEDSRRLAEALDAQLRGELRHAGEAARDAALHLFLAEAARETKERRAQGAAATCFGLI